MLLQILLITQLLFFSIQVLVHINNNQFKYYVLLIHVTQSVLTAVKY